MKLHLRLAIAILAAPLLAAPTCGQSGAGSGDAQICQDAIDYLESECNVDSSGSIESCTRWDECVATCILDASCEAIAGTDATAAASFERCSEACDGTDGSGGAGADCQSCLDYVNLESTYEELCPAAQELLDAWVTCVCVGPCDVACYSYCQGFEPDPLCSDCLETSCAAETEACLADQ